MSNFKSFVRTDIGMHSPTGGTHRAASVRAKMQNGISECYIDLRFFGEMLDEYLNRVNLNRSIYMFVEGTLMTREWQHDMEDGSVLNGIDAYILVEQFQVIDGAKDQHKI